ncbi:MAG: phosphate/phosphite/phosphonate ABC transporter substrate-binding protein [Sedimenticola sp.]
MKKLLSLLLLLFITQGISAEQALTFGIVPQQSASKLARLWTPIFNHINQETGLKIRFRTAPDIPTFEKRLAAGEYDLAYMNPYHYTVFHKAPGYQALAKARDKRIKGIMVVRKESTISDLMALDKNNLAFPAPAAFAASILIRAHLYGLGVDYTPKYVSSHDSVYRAVAKGIYPAGGGVIRTFKNVAPEVRAQLRILWTTKGYTPHAIAMHPRVKAGNGGKVLKALIGMEQSEEGKRLLESIKIKGFESATNSDWDDVRSLNIHLLTDPQENRKQP